MYSNALHTKNAQNMLNVNRRYSNFLYSVLCELSHQVDLKYIFSSHYKCLLKGLHAESANFMHHRLCFATPLGELK